MIWRHKKTHQQYSQVSYIDNGEVRVTALESGRSYRIGVDKIEQIPGDTPDAETFAHHEHLKALAHRLARELPYNIGQAVVHLALSADNPEYLLTARAAIRDEQERLRQQGSADDGGTE